MVINSRFLLVMSIFAVAAAWGSFFFGLAWSNTYYVENYRVPGIHNSTTPTSWNTTRMELDGSVKLHFPMKFSHIWPAVFITIAWFLSCCFPFRNPDEMDTSQNCCGADADESRWLMNWCKNVILGGVVILATTGCCIVLLYVFMMVSFVGYLVSEKPHTIVPTVAVMVQATLLILAIVLLFISRFRGNIEERKAAEAHQF